MESSDWAWLSQDILDLILRKLDLLSDYISFSGVCRWWRSVVWQNSRLVHSCKRLPFLLFTDEHDEFALKSLYSLTTNRLIDFRSRLPGRIVSSSHGWLITVDFEDSVISLSNPFTGDVVPLPPFPVPIPESEYVFALRIVLSADPYLNHDYIVIVLFDYSDIFFMKPRIDRNWTAVNGSLPRLFFPCGIIYWKGMVVVVDDGGSVVIVRNLDSDRPRPEKIASKDFSSRPTTYLAESSEGDLLLVRRQSLGQSGDRPTTIIDVLKLELRDDSGTVEWVETRDIGGDTLFIGHGYCVAAPATLFPAVGKNTVFSTRQLYWDSKCPMRVTGVEIFRLENGDAIDESGKAESLLRVDSSTRPPLWIMPTMRGLQF